MFLCFKAIFVKRVLVEILLQHFMVEYSIEKIGIITYLLL